VFFNVSNLIENKPRTLTLQNDWLPGNYYFEKLLRIFINTCHTTNYNEIETAFGENTCVVRACSLS